MRNEMNVLVIGLGNILLSDEGAGVRVIEALRERYCFPETVDLVDGGTMGIELVPYFQGKSHIIIIDAVRTGNQPGTVTRTDDLPAFFRNRISPHQIGLIDVLALAAITEGVSPRTVLFGIEPGNIETGLDLSSEVNGRIDFLVKCVVEELEGLGIHPLRLR